MSPLLWKDTPVWDSLAAEHARIVEDITIARHAAEFALWPHDSWEGQTRTKPHGRATELFFGRRHPAATEVQS